MNYDSIDIEITADATKANNALDKLSKNLLNLKNSLNGLNSSGLYGLANGVNRLSSSMQAMKSVGTADFTRLTKNIEKLGAINTASINKAASSMYQMSKGLGQLNSVSVTDTAANIASLASGISKLGYKSSTQAIENIPKLAEALSQLMATLSKAPSVSQNIISMTNALAKLSAQGSNVGTAAKNVSSGLNLYSKWTTTATKNTFSFASAIGKLYATYWLVFRAFSKIGEAIDYSSQLTEVQNVVDNTFGIYSDAIEDMASNSIQQLGMSALTVKQIGSTFQAMGKAVGFAQDEMADMSTSLVALTADMASFYDVEQEDVAEDLQAIFTGQTKPLTLAA